MATQEYFPLFGGGFPAGVINALAGNGLAITLTLLIFIGLPANAANATNQIWNIGTIHNCCGKFKPYFTYLNAT